MLCAVYKSPRKDETYLYVLKRDDFSQVPKALMDTFGKPVFVLMLALDKHQKLANVDINKLKQSLRESGFYLQIPPPVQSLLKQHRAANGLNEEQDGYIA